jgi:hypothetical protein
MTRTKNLTKVFITTLLVKMPYFGKTLALGAGP